MHSRKLCRVSRGCESASFRRDNYTMVPRYLDKDAYTYQSMARKTFLLKPGNPISTDLSKHG